MNRRGLTMIEILLALALLASIISVCAVWINVAATASVTAGIGAPAQREGAIQSALTRIQDDLLTGDFDIRERENQPRVRVEDGALMIELRQGSRCIYRLDHAKGQIVREHRGNLKAETRPVLNHIREFTCVIDDKKHELLVTIEHVPASTPEIRAVPIVNKRRYQL